MIYSKPWSLTALMTYEVLHNFHEFLDIYLFTPKWHDFWQPSYSIDQECPYNTYCTYLKDKVNIVDVHPKVYM